MGWAGPYRFVSFVYRFLTLPSGYMATSMYIHFAVETLQPTGVHIRLLRLVGHSRSLVISSISVFNWNTISHNHEAASFSANTIRQTVSFLTMYHIYQIRKDSCDNMICCHVI